MNDTEKIEQADDKVFQTLCFRSLRPNGKDKSELHPQSKEAISLGFYYTKVHGLSSREMERIVKKQVSHNTLNKYVKQGQDIFETCFMPMFLILIKLYEDEGIRLSLSKEVIIKTPSV